MRNIGDTKRKRLLVFEIGRCLMAFIDIHQHHIFGTNTTPSHVHHIDFSILAVGCYH